MERLREVRRSGGGGGMGMNNGVARRRPRSGGSRDSPDEDGAMEMPESTATRLRDRVSKRDRDRERERLSRGKRRRESMAIHGGGRDEGDDSSEESLGEDEDDEEDDDMSMPSRSHNPSTSSLSQGTNHHHNHQNHHVNHSNNNNQNYGSHHHQQQQQRKSLPRPMRWRADEMIGVPVPRKTRTACRKRPSSEWFEAAQRFASASPSRMSPASTSQQISPSGSNASIRKKIQKPMSGPKQPRPLPPKVSNSSSKQSFFIQEEIEVAEVLFGLTRQFKEENQKQEQKESAAEAKSRVSSPQQTLLPPESNYNSSSLPIIAPKRKKPRNLKEDEAPVSILSAAKADKSAVEIKVRLEAPSPRREKNPESPAVRNGFQPQPTAVPVELGREQELRVDLSVREPKPSVGGESDRLNRLENREEPFFPKKEASLVGSVGINREETPKKNDLPSDGTREHNFSIDLMAPPPGKLSPERGDGFFNSDADQKAQPQGPAVEMMMVSSSSSSKANSNNNNNTEKKEKENEKPTQIEKTGLVESSSSSKKLLMSKERGGLDLQLDLEKHKNEALGGAGNKSVETQHHQTKNVKVENNRQDNNNNKAVPPSTMPMPMAVGGWPGNLPQFGFMGQVPALPAGLVPVGGNPGPSNNLQPRPLLPPMPRPKRCGTHCYIAQLIKYHQQVTKMNPYWPPGGPAAPAAPPAIFGARPFGMGVVPHSEAALMGSHVPGNFPGRNLAAMPDAKGAPPNSVPKFPGNHPEEKAPPANSSSTDSAQRKQQQPPQSGQMPNMMPGPALFIPINQPMSAVAAAAVAAAAAAANRDRGTMPPGGSTSSSTSTGNAREAPTINLSFAGMPPGMPPPDHAQFITLLQNGAAYPFPVPGHAGAPPSYRGGPPGQAMPFFNPPFYPPQMPHPSQHQAQPHQQQASNVGPQQPPAHSQQPGQKTGVSSSSSSSQKNQQPHIQELSGFSDNRPQLLGAQARPQDGSDEGQDNKMPPSQKGFYGHNFSMPIHYSQNFAFLSAAGSSAALSSGNANHGEKQSAPDHQQQPPPQGRSQNARIDLASSQPFAMPPFAAFPGPGGAPVGLDFASIMQNHHIFQNHADAARHGYPHMGSVPNPSMTSQHPKPHNAADSKSASGDSTSRIAAAEEERKNMAPSAKFPSGEAQHPLSFSKKENEHTGPSISSASASDNSSRTLNLIPPYRDGHGSGNRSSNSTQAMTTASAATVPPTLGPQMLVQLQKQQQQQAMTTASAATVPPTMGPSQMLIQLQKQQQQALQQQQQQQQQQQLANSRPKSAAPSSNQAAGYPDRIPNIASFPSTLMTFPQALMQGGGSSNSPGQSPQWKPSTNSRAGTPAPSAVQAPSSAAQAGTKNNSHHLHPQSRNMQQSLPFSTHQTQISFGSANSLKATPTGPNQQGAATDLSRSLAAAMAGASPSQSASKNSASGSPPSISVSKPGPTSSTTLTPPQQHSAKNSPSSSSTKAPQQQNHHSTPSILGHPSMASANHSNMKSLNQSQQQHQLKPQAFGHAQPQLFFSNHYAQPGQPHTNAAAQAAAAAAANYHQKRHSDKTQQQQNSSSGPTVLRMPAPGLLHAAHSAVAQSAGGGSHQRMPASFYVPVAPVSVSKPSSDQKPASGN